METTKQEEEEGGRYHHHHPHHHHHQHSTLQQEKKDGKIEENRQEHNPTMMETLDQQQQQSSSLLFKRPAAKKRKYSDDEEENRKYPDMKHYTVEAYDVLNLLDPNGDIVKNMPCPAYPMLTGRYYCLFYDKKGINLYIVEEDTHWVTCIPLFELEDLGSTMTYLIKLNFWPMIKIEKGNVSIELDNCHHRDLTPYKYLHEWEIVRDPFGLYRLVTKEGTKSAVEEEERKQEMQKEIEKLLRGDGWYRKNNPHAFVVKDIKHCNEKLKMFPENLDISKAPLWENIPFSQKWFIVGVSVADNEAIYFVLVTLNYFWKEYQVCLLEDTARRDDEIDGRNHKYYQYLWSMLNNSEGINAKILFGDYAFEVEFDGTKESEWFDQTSLRVLKLSDVPFHDKKRENYIFKL